MAKRILRDGTLFLTCVCTLVLITVLLVACALSGNEISFSKVSGAEVGADIDCLFAGREPSSPVVIRSENDLDQWNQCFSGLSSFDFTQHTLIAALMRVGGCGFADCSEWSKHGAGVGGRDEGLGTVVTPGSWKTAQAAGVGA